MELIYFSRQIITVAIAIIIYIKLVSKNLYVFGLKHNFSVKASVGLSPSFLYAFSRHPNCIRTNSIAGITIHKYNTRLLICTSKTTRKGTIKKNVS